MTYIDLINQFWQKDLEFSFTADEVNLYFRLLKHANLLRWQKPRFNMAVDRLMLEVGLKTKRPFDTARKGLRDAGLIEFVNGNGRGCTTEYCILGIEIQPERDAKNTPLSATLSATIPQSFREGNGLLHKSKIKSKKTESIDSALGEKKASSTPSADPSPPDPWAAWLAENTPTVQRLKSPLTGKQWANLVADFGETTVQEVLLAMENKADLLKKYTSANLTARDWCARRQPPRPALPAPLAGQALSPEPALNPDVVAERQAQRDAEAAESRRRFRDNHAAGASA